MRKHAARGMGGAACHELDEVASLELRTRAGRWLRAIVGVLNSQNLALTTEVAGDVKGYLRECVRIDHDVLRAKVVDRQTKAGLPVYTASLDFAESNVHAQLCGQIDVAADAIAARPPGQVQQPGPQINLYGSIVQIGSKNRAEIVSLTQADRETIAKAIAAVTELLSEQRPARHAEIAEVVSDGQHELEKVSPNTVRLQTILQSLAAFVEGVQGAPAVTKLITDALSIVLGP